MNTQDICGECPSLCKAGVSRCPFRGSLIGRIHVFSEKLYMPHIYHVYNDCKDYIGGVSVIRLLGGNRKQIEINRTTFAVSDLTGYVSKTAI
jgi:hypothetical protein